MDCIVHEVAKSWMWLSSFHFHFFPMTEPSAKQLGFLTKVVRNEREDKCDQKKAMQQLFVDKKNG